MPTSSIQFSSVQLFPLWIGKISEFVKNLEMQRPVRFGAAPVNVERGAEIGSTCTIVELPRKFFSPVFCTDPTSEIGKIWKHYDYPRFLDPLLPVLQWGICQWDKSSNSGF